MEHSYKVGAALFADARCPTCELWLHENIIHEPRFSVNPHYHSEDEVIVVTGGEIILGKRTYGRGAALTVARDTVYGSHACASGLSFINFRAGRPSYAPAGDRHPVDELQFYTELPPPQFLTP
jgi:hypothetical protein